MKRKTLIIVEVIMIVVALSLLCINAFQKDIFKDLGENAKTHSNKKEKINKYGDFKLAKKGIYSTEKAKLNEIKEIGQDVIVTKEQIDAAKDYYENKGVGSKESEEKAVAYVEEENALYAEAINNGYDVTEKEIDEYINKLKRLSETAENKEDIEKVISGFGSEKEYWEYEKKIYKQLLPIQNYISDLEKEFMEKNRDNYEPSKIEKMWDTEFKKVKDNAVKKQKHTKVNKKTKISVLEPFWIK